MQVSGSLLLWDSELLTPWIQSLGIHRHEKRKAGQPFSGEDRGEEAGKLPPMLLRRHTGLGL